MNGFIDRYQKAGPITGSGPGFEKAMAKFKHRVDTDSRVGRWRKSPAKWKKNDGTRIDPEWVIVDYGQEE